MEAGSQTPAQSPSMAAIQGASPPAWRGRSWWRLLGDVIGGPRQNIAKIRQLIDLVIAFFRPGLVARRLGRLRELGHIDVVPSVSQLLVAARDQIVLSASAETRIFYRSQGIPWAFHNLRRFISGPATMLDPCGLFSPRDAIVHHVLQTFHRHPVYDLVLLRAHPDGIAEMARQADQIVAGSHPHQAALTSLIEDGSYHERLVHEIAVFTAEPHVRPRPIPEGLVADPALMLGMDQFKDIAGYTRYAARLDVGVGGAVLAWLVVAFDETIGSLIRVKFGPRVIRMSACDRDVAARWVPLPPAAASPVA